MAFFSKWRFSQNDQTFEHFGFVLSHKRYFFADFSEKIFKKYNTGPRCVCTKSASQLI
jgi:hypothetical protein